MFQIQRTGERCPQEVLAISLLVISSEASEMAQKECLELRLLRKQLENLAVVGLWLRQLKVFLFTWDFVHMAIFTCRI